MKDAPSPGGYVLIDGLKYAYDSPKDDSVSAPVACVVCGNPVHPEEAAWRHYYIFAHLGCAPKEAS